MLAFAAVVCNGLGREVPSHTYRPASMIQAGRLKCNGYVLWHFIRGLAEKVALGRCQQSRVNSGKDNPTKSVVLSQGTEIMGVTRSLQSLAVWRCRYTRFSATMRPRQLRQRWGPRLIPDIGCAVNMIESDSRLTRLHRIVSGGLNGWGSNAQRIR
jgi:hypothetical protein